MILPGARIPGNTITMTISDLITMIYTGWQQLKKIRYKYKI